MMFHVASGHAGVDTAYILRGSPENVNTSVQLSQLCQIAAELKQLPVLWPTYRSFRCRQRSVSVDTGCAVSGSPENMGITVGMTLISHTTTEL
jgi:hypothetical protein